MEKNILVLPAGGEEKEPFKNMPDSLAGSSVDWAWAANQRVTGSIPSQGTCLGCGARSPVRAMWEATTHWCVSPSLAPSLSLSLKKMCVSIYTHTHKYIYILFIYIYICICIYVYMCLCVYMCIYTHMCVRTHTHTYLSTVNKVGP